MGGRRSSGLRRLSLHCSDGGFGTFREFKQGTANLDVFADANEKLRHVTGAWRGYFHHRLFGFNRHQRLIDNDVVAVGHVPSDDLSLTQSLTKIRKPELSH
jgi:hypothetical protein